MSLSHFGQLLLERTSSTPVFYLDRKRRLDVSMGSGREYDLDREPAKVIRHTYSKQLETLAMHEKEGNIPPGFMRRVNYIDVTKDYWEVANVKIPLFPSDRQV